MIVVVDLDKTLLKIDSFPAWYFYILKQSGISNPILFIHLIYLALKRCLRIDNHVSFKEKLMKLLEKNDLHEVFAKFISQQVRLDLVQYLKTLDQKATLVLSTAAPKLYVQHLVRLLPLHFTHVHASEILDGKLVDNAGEMKAKLFRQQWGQMPCDLFITDHHSDLPLMKISKKVLLVEPTQKTLDTITPHQFNMEVL